MSRLGSFVGSLVLCPLLASVDAAAAQGRHVFAVDRALSGFSFSGQISYPPLSGPIVGNPNTFMVSGAADVDLTVAGGSVVAGQFVRGTSAVLVPPLAAVVPNPFPFLPPLATITVTGTELVFVSVDPVTSAPATFAVAPNGSFSTSLAAVVLSGTATVVALGQTQTVPLAGQTSPPRAVNGTIVPTADGFRLAAPVRTTFTFNDPQTGASGSLTLAGTLTADDLALATDVETISLAAGGTQTFRLSAGSSRGGSAYWLLGSASGTQPATSVGSVSVPLNADDYTTTTLVLANMPPFGNTAAALDALGVATATFSLPPLPIPQLAGLRLDHACVVIDGGRKVVFASNPVPLTLVP